MVRHASFRVQENLKFEQRSVLQFNWVLVHRILSPIQVALFMVHAWPSHCDCLAMVNTVNGLKDELMVCAFSYTFRVRVCQSPSSVVLHCTDSADRCQELTANVRSVLQTRLVMMSLTLSRV